MRYGAARKEAEARLAAAGREPIADILRRFEESGRKKAP
jgi:hypothetical protein